MHTNDGTHRRHGDYGRRHPESITETWWVGDVAERCRECGVELTDEQQRHVLYLVDRYHDADVGINWDAIDFWIGQVSGKGMA